MYVYCETRRTPRVLVIPPTFTIQSDFQVILEKFRNRKVYSPAGYVDYEPNRLEDQPRSKRKTNGGRNVAEAIDSQIGS